MSTLIVTSVVKPWGDGTGYPQDLFTQTVNNGLLCTRQDCGSPGMNNGKRVLRDPYQASCGHRFCKECVEIIKSRPASEHFCDACKQEKFSDNEVQASAPEGECDSHSENVEIDAQQEGALDDCKLDMTQFREDKAASRDILKIPLKCPYQCESSGRLNIKNLERHMEQCPKREEACRHCGELVSHSRMENHLQISCRSKPSQIPNNDDGGSASRETLSAITNGSSKKRYRTEDSDPDRSTTDKRPNVSGHHISYDITGKKGLVAVINNYTVERGGTEEDEDAIVRVFGENPFRDHYELYGYSMVRGNKHNRNLSNQDMKNYLNNLKEYLKINKDKYCSFILFIMSHGNEKGVSPYPANEPVIPIADILKRYEEALPGKPKVIIIQACNGSEHNTAVHVDHHGQPCVGDSPSLPPPKGADMLVASSTLKGYYSYRQEGKGSFFIQTLMKLISECSKSSENFNAPLHLADILVMAHYEVSNKTANYTDKDSKVAFPVRQQPYHETSFNKSFYLLP